MDYISNGLGVVLNSVLVMMQYLIIASLIIDWVNADPYNKIVVFIRNITNPLYRPIRRLIKDIDSPIDLAPLIVILIIIFLQNSLIKFLTDG